MVIYQWVGKELYEIYFWKYMYSEYIHEDPSHNFEYIRRCNSNQSWSGPINSWALAYYILWNEPTIRGSLADYDNKCFRFFPAA